MGDLLCMIWRSTENPVSTWVTSMYSIVRILINTTNRNTDSELGENPLKKLKRSRGDWKNSEQIGDLLYQGQK